MNAPGRAPPAGEATGGATVAVIIPAYKQPGLLAEAIHSVLDQRTGFPVGAVVVDDGCPLEETRAVGLTYARAHPEQVCYLRRANGGLSAARNTGLDWALAAWPNARAFYLLDADNRLHSDFLARALKLLEQSPAEVGWIYPDFDMFGLTQNDSTRGDYSVLMHLLENYCEAGSLVRRDVLEAGIRFDETMQGGFEDWDFWLQAAAAGFVGRHLPCAGFQYRKRMESMLARSETKREALMATMRAKQSKLFHPRRIMALARSEMPSFALYDGDGGAVRFRADPTAAAPGRTETRDEARRLFVESLEAPATVHFPGVMCFGTARALASLETHRILRNVAWHAELLLREKHCVPVFVQEGGPTGFALDTEDGGCAAEAPLVFLSTKMAREAARDPEAGWLESIKSETPRPLMAQIRVTLPQGLDARDFAVGERAPADTLLDEVATLRGMVAARAGRPPRDWRREARKPREGAAEALEALLQCGPLFPCEKKEGVRDFGFIIPLSSFGGVERGIRNYARVLRKRGWRPHLFLTWKHGAHLNRESLSVFESVNFLNVREAEWTHPNRHYFGVWTSEFGDRPASKDGLGFLAGMDAVLNNHSFAGHAFAAGLRNLGIKTYVGLHLTERMPDGQPLGNTHIALAYEHAYDGFVVISQDLRQWCVGQGVPAEKIHIVRNAPAYPSAPGSAIRAVKARREYEGPLRVLFLGRFDRQKGLDRLTEIIRRTRAENVAWRLVGKAVVEDSSVELEACEIPIEPPAHTSDELDALYEWADIVILTSRFEGVPLTILEAQRAGCVVLSTDVGAVSEIVDHGRDGVLVAPDLDEETLVGEFCAHLVRLAADRVELRRLGLRAARRVSRVSWDRSLARWADHLEQVCPIAPSQEMS